MSIVRACDFCKQVTPHVVSRYTMSHKTRSFDADFPERVSTVSAGGIDMCKPCWERIAEPRKSVNGGHAHRLITDCDRCTKTLSGVNDPLRYTLKTSRRRDSDGKMVTRGAGGVVLCRSCWRDVGYSKMRKGRHDILVILDFAERR